MNIRVRKALFPSLLLLSLSPVLAKLSPLAAPPDWTKLNIFQETITKEEFVTLLDKVYAPNGAWKEYISLDKNGAWIATRKSTEPFLLKFAASPEQAKPLRTYWRSKSTLPPEEPNKPLAGLRVALDPGHIGGYWAQMEERWFQIGNTKPVTEGDMTLLVAKMVATQLQNLGAQVYLTRSKSSPTTSLRPKGLKEEAESSLKEKGSELTAYSLEKESERLFYRVGEIRRRGKLVNENIRPDVVVCLHFNAEAWGDANNPKLSDINHLHFLVSGALSAEELAYEDQRFDMLAKLLNRSYKEELALTNVMSRKMAAATGLPPYNYRENKAAIRVNDNPYVWARNLLANRLYLCPVVFVEPYVMNNNLVFARIQAGDYEGLRNFGGSMRKSIYREYADAIVDGLLAFYSGRAAQ